MQAGVACRCGEVRGRAASALSVVAVVVLLCGCGSSDTTANFKSGYNALRGPLNQTAAQITAAFGAVGHETDSQVAATFQTIAQRWQGHVAQLRKLKPPSNVAADWNSVVAAASRLDADLNAFAAGAAAHNSSAVKRALTSLQADAQHMQTAAGPVRSKLGLK